MVGLAKARPNEESRVNQYMYHHGSLAFISYTSDRLSWHYQVQILLSAFGVLIL